MKKEYTAYKEIIIVIRETVIPFDSLDFSKEGAKRKCKVSMRVIVN
jgi:hypothetical protein